ncbi:MAG: ArsA-related P-loop ATPase [Acidobacteriota bacterium]
MSAIHTDTTDATTASDTLSRLTRRQLIVVTGKGGVGKSAITAALGKVLAAHGRRTLLLEIDPRENLHQMLAVPPSGGEIVSVEDSLYLQNLKPQQVVDWIVERQVKIGLLVRRIQKNPVYHRFSEGAPGLREMAVIGHIQRMVRGEVEGAPPLETVILDAPATGHSIYQLTAPRLFAETIHDGPFAELARDAAGFLADPTACGVVVVTLAEEMPVQEALELRLALEENTGRGPECLVINGLYPDLPAAPIETGDALLRLWAERRHVNDHELDRLRREWPGPRVDLPLLAIDQGPELIRALYERLETGLMGVAT